MLVVCRLILLYGWVCIEAGLGAALTPSLWLLLEGIFLRCFLPFLVIIFFGCIHHVYIM